jgi:hypothetical protein
MPRTRARTRRADRLPRRRRSWPLIGILLTLIAGAAVAWPNPHSWQTLGPKLGRIRWVETHTGMPGEAPLAPGWIRTLRRSGIPWPTDLPLEPVPASFGGGSGDGQAAAWYLVHSARRSNDLWHLEKRSVKLTDGRGAEVPWPGQPLSDDGWPGGSGAVLIDGERRLHYLYLGVPRELSGTGAHLRFRLSQFNGPTSQEVTVAF